MLIRINALGANFGPAFGAPDTHAPGACLTGIDDRVPGPAADIDTPCQGRPDRATRVGGLVSAYPIAAGLR
jgi:hypothetical protein